MKLKYQNAILTLDFSECAHIHDAKLFEDFTAALISHKLTVERVNLAGICFSLVQLSQLSKILHTLTKDRGRLL